MVWFGFEPGAEEWKSQKNPLSYGGTPNCSQILKIRKNNHLAFFILVKFTFVKVAKNVSKYLGYF